MRKGEQEARERAFTPQLHPRPSLASLAVNSSELRSPAHLSRYALAGLLLGACSLVSSNAVTGIHPSPFACLRISSRTKQQTALSDLGPR